MGVPVNKCLHFFVSSFYLMYFDFISYVYLYNVLHFILNKSNPIHIFLANRVKLLIIADYQVLFVQEVFK